MKQKILDTLEIDKNYSVTIKDYSIDKVILSYDERQIFSKLSNKSKLTRLEHVKKLRNIESTLVDSISQSKYLYLLKDNLGFHLRIHEDVEEDEENLEIVIIEHLLSMYPIYISSEYNKGMSGDINRILISKGTSIQNL
jgi:hypothetical protein